MRITENGFVGIGTTSPGQKLDVIGNIRSNGQLISTVATGTSPLLVTSTTLVTNLNADLLDNQHGSYYMPATTDNWVNTTGDTMTGQLYMSGTTANIRLGSNWLSGDGGDEGIFIAADGKVGIGTFTPNELLHLNANSGDIAIAFGTGTSISSINNPTIGVNDSYPYPSDTNWTSPENILSSNNIRASVATNASGSKYLKATGFGLTIPPGSVITGIVGYIEGYVTGTVYDKYAYLVIGNTVATSQSKTSCLTSSETTVTTGGSTDTWVKIYPRHSQ